MVPGDPDCTQLRVSDIPCETDRPDQSIRKNTNGGLCQFAWVPLPYIKQMLNRIGDRKELQNHTIVAGFQWQEVDALLYRDELIRGHISVSGQYLSRFSR